MEEGGEKGPDLTSHINKKPPDRDNFKLSLKYCPPSISSLLIRCLMPLDFGRKVLQNYN